MRDVQELRFTTHDGVELFYRHWPASRPAPDGTRQAVLLFHRGHEHSGRIAHLVDELDLPEYDFFAWDARGRPLARRPRRQPELCHQRARRTDLRRPYPGRPRYRRRADGGGGAERRRGAGFHLGPRLRAEGARTGAGFAGVPGQALRAVRPQRAETDAPVARQFLRQQLCQGTLPQSRPAADRLLRHRPADRQGDLGERPARPLRSRRAGGSGRTGDPDSHPTADFRGRLRRPSCAAGALLRASRQPAQGKAHPARLLPRHPWRARSSPGRRPCPALPPRGIRHGT